MTVLEPELAIIDSHHHLWDFRSILPEQLDKRAHPFLQALHQSSRYLFDELHADCREQGHNILGTVFVQCNAFYRAKGPERLKPVGEVEFANGVAARSASGIYGPFEACAAIVGYADLTMGASVAEVLEAEMAAGNGRFRGIRQIGANDPDPEVLGPLAHAPGGLYEDAKFREGFASLGKLGLRFDAWVLETQIDDVTELARAFPDQAIVLDHVGTPLGIAAYRGRQAERFPQWREAVRRLAKCPNVMVKLGGLAMPFSGLGKLGPGRRAGAEELADLFRPYIETCIEAFGPQRSMFESNFPVDQWGADYPTLWNAFKLLCRGVSEEDKHRLFAGSAAQFYGLGEP